MAELETLGATIADLSKTLASRLQEGSYPKPSFAADSPPGFPPKAEIQGPRLQLIEALTDLLHLATGAGDYLFLHGGLFLLHDPTILDVLNQFDFFTKIPLTGSASYSEIASATTLPEKLVKRILRYAFTMHFFAPEGVDRVKHTAFSAHASRTPVLRSWMGHHLEEARQATTKAAEALRLYSSGKEEPSEDMDETPFGLSWPRLKNGGLATWWSVGQDDPKEAWRSKRFAEAMEASVLSGVVQSDDVVDSFDWAKLGNATVVDVGGSDGALAKLLARKHSQLNFIVQDLPRVEADFNANLSADAVGRVTFQPQDFFEPQPQPADVFLLKHVLHNWSDKYALKILRNLVAMLKPGGRIIICDSVVPDQENALALPLNVRKGIAAADIQMFVMLNAAERTVDDWKRLTKKADERLKVVNIKIVPGALVGLIEVLLET